MGTQVLLLENIQQLTKAGSKGREPEAIIGVSLNETHLVLLLNEIYIRMLCTSCHKSLPALILCGSGYVGGLMDCIQMLHKMVVQDNLYSIAIPV